MEDLFDSAFGFDAGPETNGVGPGYRYGMYSPILSHSRVAAAICTTDVCICKVYPSCADVSTACADGMPYAGFRFRVAHIKT